MMAEKANVIEKKELSYLYQEYINDGRSVITKANAYRSVKSIAVN